MPIYEFVCEECGASVETIVNFKTTVMCTCGEQMTRQVSCHAKTPAKWLVDKDTSKCSSPQPDLSI